MTDLPEVLIRPETVVCPGHGEHLRAQFPKGFLIVGITLFRAVMAKPQFIDEARKRVGEDKDGKVPVAGINAVLERKPMCYFATRAEIRTALMEADIFTIGLCHICGRPGPGGAYSVSNMGRMQELSHVCVECALNTGERVHNDKPNGGTWK